MNGFKIKLVLVVSKLSIKPDVLIDKETRLLPSIELKNDETVAECLKKLVESYIDINFEWMEQSIVDNGYLRTKSNEIVLLFSYHTFVTLHKISNAEWVNNVRILDEKTKNIKEHPEEVEFLYRTGTA